MTIKFNPIRGGRLSLDKVLFAIACFYLMIVVFWLSSQGKLRLNQTPAETPPPQSSVSLEDAEFIAYLQKSLQELEQKEQHKQAQQKQQQTLPKQPTPKSIPLPPAPPPPTQTATAPQIVERIYVPIYPQVQQQVPQQQQPTVAIKPPTPPAKVTPKWTQISKPLVPPPPPPTVPVLGSPTVSLAPPTLPPAPSSGNNTLVGILEAGEQSSAIFTLNGTTRRYQLGEPIGSTGWILTSIQNQQAILSRKGKIRGVGVGQSF